MRVGLLFGSFNPVHLGHLIVADHFITQGLLDEVWLVVSPQNPFKAASSLVDIATRVDMARLAIQDNATLCVCDIEVSMPVPSYTSDTLRRLVNEFDHASFHLIIGDDLARDFHLWRDAEWILSQFPVYVFPRLHNPEDPGYIPPGDERMRHVQAPRIGISSTLIRERIAEGRSMRYLVTEAVREFILSKGVYRQ